MPDTDSLTAEEVQYITAIVKYEHGISYDHVPKIANDLAERGYLIILHPSRGTSIVAASLGSRNTFGDKAEPSQVYLKFYDSEIISKITETARSMTTDLHG